MKNLKIWIVTNRGGKNLKPLNYFGYRIPVYFTKKEAYLAKQELDNKDPIHANQKVIFERKVLPATISYNPDL